MILNIKFTKKVRLPFKKNEWLEVGTKVFQLRAIQNNGQI